MINQKQISLIVSGHRWLENSEESKNSEANIFSQM